MEFKSANSIFNRLGDKKKTLVLSTSVKEFSEKGFNSANINTIAENAGISIGAMYKYFENKRALYLACVEWAMLHLNQEIAEAVSQDDEILTLCEKIIRVIQRHRKENEQFTKLYYEMATEGNAEYAMLISSQIEGVTADLYASYIKSAQDNNRIRTDIDPRFFAFFMDNLFMMLQFSYSCDYYIDRMQIYTYDDVFERDDVLLQQMLLFIKGALYLPD